MCGIAGIINKNNQPVDEHRLKMMTNMVVHRGPDNQGFYVHQNIGLGHRRLSIIDLSHTGDQPMKLGDDYVITYNGEIYNYIEIREELIKLGYSFSTQSDTEVILNAYKMWGTKCVEKFNGMWAFAIYDIKNKIVFCSRDRFGVKPFYYTIKGGSFYFGSEIKQFIGLHSTWKANKSVLMDYLIFNLLDHTDECFFEGIKKLQGSHNLVYNLEKNKFKISKYYKIKINKNIGALNEDDSIQTLRTQINNSVQFRMRSDVKVGTCLSGGLDSSYIAALASKKYNNANEKFIAITAQSLDKREDETVFAEKVVNSSNLNWVTTKPTAEDFIGVLDEVIYNQEEPFISPSVYMQHFVMKKAREAGIVVLLDGQGADELLLGYQRYLGAYFKSLPKIDLLSNILKSKNQYGVSAFAMLKYHWYFTSYSVRYKRNISRFSNVSKEYLDCVNRGMIRQMTNSYKDINELQQLEIFSTQLPSLLRFEDKNSMANSIESRLPFLDWNFVETALSINNSFKIKDGWSKYILRKSMEGQLPDDITWRKSKIGFNAPTSIWFHHFNNIDSIIHKSTILNKIFNNKIPHYQDDNVKWRLINIARWEELYNVTID